MPTCVYIDGFNLYYGSLKGTANKWLDLEQLCRRLLPQDDVQRIRYFTARITARPQDPQGPQRQDAYLRALATLPLISIHEGHFRSHPVKMPLAHPPAHGSALVEVIRTEEKGSDVNLASYLLRDGFRGEYDTAVVVSNDADLAEPIRMVKRELGLRVGVFNPHPKKRRSAELQAVPPSFHRQVNPSVLSGSQLPDVLSDHHGRLISKPSKW